MTADFEAGDDALLAELAELMATADAVPASVVAAAKASFRQRPRDATDEALAALIYDSELDGGTPLPGVKELALARGAGSRRLTVEAPELTVELKVFAEGRVIGQLVPPQEADIEVLTSGTSVRTRADALGRFSADGLAAGPARIRCQPLATDPARTDWFVL